MVLTFAGGFRRISSPGGVVEGKMWDREGNKRGIGERREKYRYCTWVIIRR